MGIRICDVSLVADMPEQAFRHNTTTAKDVAMRLNLEIELQFYR